MGDTHTQQAEQVTAVPWRLRAKARQLWSNSELHALLFEPRLNDDIEAALIDVALYLSKQGLPEDVAASLAEVEEWACYRHGYFRTRRRARWLYENRYELVVATLSFLVLVFLPELVGLLP